MPSLVVRLALPATALLAAGCAPETGPLPSAAAGQARQCFSARTVNSFSPVRGQQIVDVRVGASRYYRLTLAGVCPEVDWSMRLVLRTRGGSSWVCQGGDAEIAVRGPAGRETCLVSDIQPISRDQYRASRRRR